MYLDNGDILLIVYQTGPKFDQNTVKARYETLSEITGQVKMQVYSQWWSTLELPEWTKPDPIEHCGSLDFEGLLCTEWCFHIGWKNE